MELIKHKYEIQCITPSDINEHLPTLFEYSKQCESVIECGVRGIVSSWAFIYGLLNNEKNKKKIIMNDIYDFNFNEVERLTKNTNILIEKIIINDLNLELNENYDMVFIDTFHVYGQLKRELNKFSKITNKYIIMHDTEVDAINGEYLRIQSCMPDIKELSISTGIPVEEIKCGLRPAINEFLEENKNWVVHQHFTNNNGLTILKKCS